MKQTLSQAFKSINEQNPPVYLESAVLLKIKAIREKQAKKKLFFSYAGMAGSFMVLFFAFAEFGNAFLQSEFWNLAFLVSSDILVVAGNWKDYAMSLLETFPIAHAIIFLAPVFTLLLSLNFGINLHRRCGSGVSMKKACY